VEHYHHERNHQGKDNVLLASPVHRRNFVRQIHIAFGNNHLQALAKNEG
jgi:hypothetical protein